MVVELSNINLPVDSVLGSVLNGDWEISTVVESAELRWWNLSSSHGTGDWLLHSWLVLWLAERVSVSSNSLTLLGVFCRQTNNVN